MLSFFPRGVLDEILNLIESVSEDLPSCSSLSFMRKKNQPNLMQMLQSWSIGSINGEIELYSSRSLQNTGFMALALIALEKQS